jgi:DNA-binding transcriptional LysR family regulator
MSLKLKIYDLKCFVALSELKSFTKAADKMLISQPAFSRIIQKLESTVGTQLVDRYCGSISLTISGEIFLTESNHLIDAYESSMKNIAKLSGQNECALNIGFTTFSTYIPGFYKLLDVLSKLSLTANLLELSSNDLVQKLQNSEIDIAIVHFPIASRTLNTHKVASTDTVVLLPPEVCCFRENKKYEVILNEDAIDKPYNEYIVKKLSDYNLTPKYLHKTQLAQQNALNNNGVLIYPESLGHIIANTSPFKFETIKSDLNLFGLYLVKPKNVLNHTLEKSIELLLKDVSIFSNKYNSEHLYRKSNFVGEC